MPNHLDEEGKKPRWVMFSHEGGCEDWIHRNCGVDDMAKKGATPAAPPGHLLARDFCLRTITRTVQRMLVHVWAGIVKEKDADGHEADLDDSILGFDCHGLGGEQLKDS